MALPLVLVHGYSSNGSAFDPLLQRLGRDPKDVANIHVGNYRSLTNDLTIKDIARGFERALSLRVGLSANEPFDAIVHSTGMLVMRTWLTGDPSRIARLKHLIGIAPATWGSPLAHKGRSWLGAIFKGNKNIGPDFLAAGDEVLDGLELGSAFTWQLAQHDLFGDATLPAVYGPDDTTPYVFVFVGNRGYEGFSSLANEDGTDGTVRWAGVSLNARQIKIDLTPKVTLPGAEAQPIKRFTIDPWRSVSDIPAIMINDRDHGSILGDPPPELIGMITSALTIEDKPAYDAWCTAASTRSATTNPKTSQPLEQWQQFVVHAVDTRGDSIDDYNAKLGTRDATGTFTEIAGFETDVHAYARDMSYRCFHVNLAPFMSTAAPPNLWMQLTAVSGSRFVTYQGYLAPRDNDPAQQDAEGTTYLDLTPLVTGTPAQGGEQTKLFFPYTTTLIELRLYRDTLPIALNLANNVYQFDKPFTDD
jgi:pimeloyl-ACP methyl ester carboxylesterase